MRALTLIALATLSLAACRNNDQNDNNVNIDENLAAENIVSNVVTAIDAVTGDAANMAADVNYTEVATLADESGTGNSSTGHTAAARPTKPSTPATTSTPAPASNTTAPATAATNSTE
jgi:hypothetical protein